MEEVVSKADLLATCTELARRGQRPVGTAFTKAWELQGRAHSWSRKGCKIRQKGKQGLITRGLQGPDWGGMTEAQNVSCTSETGLWLLGGEWVVDAKMRKQESEQGLGREETLANAISKTAWQSFKNRNLY